MGSVPKSKYIGPKITQNQLDRMIKKKYKVVINNGRKESMKIKFEVDMTLESNWSISNNPLSCIFYRYHFWKGVF